MQIFQKLMLNHIILNHMFISDEDVARYGYKFFHKLKQQMKMMKLYLFIFEAFKKYAYLC